MPLTILQTLSGCHKVFKTEAEAEAMVATLRTDDPTDPLEYRVEADPLGTGKAIIKVFDDGEFVDCL